MHSHFFKRWVLFPKYSTTYLQSLNIQLEIPRYIQTFLLNHLGKKKANYHHVIAKTEI